MAETPTLIQHTTLTEFITRALVAMKMPKDRADITAGLMVRTDLRGVDSHGIDMLPRYHELWRQGFVVMEADPILARATSRPPRSTTAPRVSATTSPRSPCGWPSRRRRPTASAS